MRKAELEERIEELEAEIERLEEEINLLDTHKEVDSMNKEVVYITKGLIKAFMDEGFLKDEAIDLTKTMITAGLRQ